LRDGLVLTFVNGALLVTEITESFATLSLSPSSIYRTRSSSFFSAFN